MTELFFYRNELQGSRIHAVAQPGRLGTIVKNMAEMAVAAATEHFSAARE